MRDRETVRMCLRALMLAAVLVRMWGGPAVAHAEAERVGLSVADPQADALPDAVGEREKDGEGEAERE